MAQLKNLTAGQDYPVKSGEYAGKTATVLTVEFEPDGTEHARKILVSIDGEQVYILPRLIDDGTLTPGEALRTAQQVILQSAVPAASPFPTARPVTVTAEAQQEQYPLTSPDDPRLDAYRPDPNDPEIKGYISRTLPGGIVDTDALLTYWREKKNVLLVGDTQSGKTLLVRVLAVLAAKEAGYEKPFPVFTLSGSDGITNYELFGQSVPYVNPVTGIEELVWLPGVVSLAAAAGGFLYIDEASALEPRTTQALNPLCDARRHFVNYARPVKVPGDGFVPEVVEAHPELWIIGTYNEGYAGTGRLNEALVNRFVTLPWGYDSSVEEKLIASPTVRLLAEALRTARDNRQIGSPVGTSLLQELQSRALASGAAFALWAFTGSFPGRDRERVEAIIQERSILSLLNAEVENALASIRPAEPVEVGA
jgi:hypothetical protein